MKHTFSRRTFLASTTAFAVAAGLPFAPQVSGAEKTRRGSRKRLRKALIIERPTEDDFKKLKDAGFDGVEGGVIPQADAENCRAVADKLGMRVHSVLRGWAEFNSPEPAKVAASIQKTEDALRAAQGFGADAVLLVPCRIGGMNMPKPREFEIEFDPKTGHISRVVAGDNARYADYIKAHNHACDTTREAMKQLIPLAEKARVVITLENVWNNLWVKPAIFQNFVASFKSRWVKAYFDIGNHVKYAPPQDWILTLGKLIAKCHVKDFKLNADPGGAGEFVNIRDGSVDWPVVRAALEKVGYNDWLTIEGGNLSPEEHSRRLDLIISGQ